MKKILLTIGTSVAIFCGYASSEPVLAQGDPVGVCKDPRGCDPAPSSPGTGTSSGPTIWDTFRANREAGAREKRLKEATEANLRGIAAWNRYDYETAVKEFTEAHEKNPENATIKDNLEKAKQSLEDRRNSDARSAVEAAKRAQISGEAAKSMAASMQDAADSVITKPVTNGLAFGDMTDLKDVPASKPRSAKDSNGSNLGCKPAGGSLTFGDPSTVDTRCVSTGLTKDIIEAVDGAFSKSPAGVAERVRKGFQAIMATDEKDRDWKTAKTLFEDALKRDPGNAGLKSLVDLAGYSLVESPLKVAKLPPEQLNLPSPDDLDFLFPDATQRPEPGDIELLFNNRPKRSVKDIIADAALSFWNKVNVPLAVVTFGDGDLSIFPVDDDRLVLLPDGPFVIGNDGKPRLSTKHQDYELWKQTYVGKSLPQESIPNKP